MLRCLVDPQALLAHCKHCPIAVQASSYDLQQSDTHKVSLTPLSSDCMHTSACGPESTYYGTSSRLPTEPWVSHVVNAWHAAMVALQVWNTVLAHLPLRAVAVAELETSAEVSPASDLIDQLSCAALQTADVKYSTTATLVVLPGFNTDE